MGIFGEIKKLKNIVPDEAYSKNSLRLILSEPVNEVTGFRTFLRLALRSGSAVAVAGIFLIIILGSLSFIKTFTPVGISSLDPTGLRAEAQAIDIQIELANFNYKEIAASAGFTGGAKTTAAFSKNNGPTASAPAAGPETTSSAPTIDDVLEKLSQ